MHKASLLKMLESVRKGTISVEKALEQLRYLPYEDVTSAKVDHHRHLMQGIPEVIYAEGKSVSDIQKIAQAMHKRNKRFLITRATQEIFDRLKIRNTVFYPASGMIASGGHRGVRKGNILVVTAGTSDIPVAEEAAVTASFLGSRVESEYDIGVAGIHRALDKRHKIASCRVIIVVAGMEGALPSVIGGLTDRPLIAVPTSTGYGTSFSGLTALFGMLNSCVPGIAVMNIDNGFGAGCLAHKINTL